MTLYTIARLKAIRHYANKNVQVSSWDATQVAKLVPLEEYQYFWFEDRDRIIERDTDCPYEILKIETRVVKTSPRYYVDAYVETLEDLMAKKDRGLQRVIQKMQDLGWSKVVQGVHEDNNMFEQFTDEDFLVDLNGNIIRV